MQTTTIIKSYSSLPKQFRLQFIYLFIFKFCVSVICRRNVKSGNKDVFGSGTSLRKSDWLRISWICLENLLLVRSQENLLYSVADFNWIISSLNTAWPCLRSSCGENMGFQLLVEADAGHINIVSTWDKTKRAFLLLPWFLFPMLWVRQCQGRSWFDCKGHCNSWIYVKSLGRGEKCRERSSGLCQSELAVLRTGKKEIGNVPDNQ